MNTVLFYGGLFISCISFLIALFLFFYYRIPSVVGYLSRMKQKGVGSVRTSLLTNTRLSTTAGVPKQTSGFTASADLTEILTDRAENETEIMYDDEATAILSQNEEDITEIL